MSTEIDIEMEVIRACISPKNRRKIGILAQMAGVRHAAVSSVAFRLQGATEKMHPILIGHDSLKEKCKNTEEQNVKYRLRIAQLEAKLNQFIHQDPTGLPTQEEWKAADSASWKKMKEYGVDPDWPHGDCVMKNSAKVRAQSDHNERRDFGKAMDTAENVTPELLERVGMTHTGLK